MADSWGEYFGGSEEQKEADRRRRQADYDAMRAGPVFQALGRLGDTPISGEMFGLPTNRDYDPREIRAMIVNDTLVPSVETDFGRDVGRAASRAIGAAGPVYSAVFETTMRPRDTLIKAAQAWNDYNSEATRRAGGSYDPAVNDKFYKAMSLLGRVPLSVVYPPAAAGTPGSPDDWRADARELGIGEGNILAVDFLSDPETYLPIPIPFKVAAKAGRASRYAKPAINAMRYGRGVPAHLVDEAGEVIRRLRNAPAVR